MIMKKVVLALTLLLVSLVGNAQVNHLKFAGIPIDGTQESFETQLINKKGFRKVMWKGQPFLEGFFLNETVMVQTALGPSSSYATKAVGKIEHDYDGGDIETKRR